MFKFLFRRKNGEVEARVETQRETLTRALDEVNAIIALMDPKPAITFDPAAGSIALDLPEQMPDEALALPAPGEAATDGSEAEAPSTDDAAKADAGDQKPA